MNSRAAIAGILLMATSANAAPDFVPSPSQVFDGFVAINAPRPDVPVGALWIDGYGPTGSAADPANVETVRSLTGMVIDKNLQLSLSAGLLEMIGIDPRFRDHYAARFGELSIVRVKDVSRLEGPKGEPRIIEALKAGTVTVTTDGEIGLNARTIGWQVRDVSGDSTNGRTRSRMIEGRDLFIALRVATPKLVEGKPRRVELTPGPSGDRYARFDNYRISIRFGECATQPATAEPCIAAASAGVVKLSSHPTGEPDAFLPFDDAGEAKLPLPVPIADGEGGLFDRVVLRRARGCDHWTDKRCTRSIVARYVGHRLQDVKRLKAKGW